MNNGVPITKAYAVRRRCDLSLPLLQPLVIIMPDCLILYAGGRGGWCRCLSVPSSSYTTRPGSTSCVTDPAAGLKPKPTTDRCTNTVKFCRHFPDSATWRYPSFSPTVSDIAHWKFHGILYKNVYNDLIRRHDRCRNVKCMLHQFSETNEVHNAHYTVFTVKPNKQVSTNVTTKLQNIVKSSISIQYLLLPYETKKRFDLLRHHH